MATVENLTDLEDDSDGWKTYYIRIVVLGCIFYKIGRCKGSVKNRFHQEPRDTLIQIIRIWQHKSEALSCKHEAKLEKEGNGFRPYIGRCGPLVHGGNTEVYPYDLMGGESPPINYIARMHSNRYGELHTRALVDSECIDSYRYLEGEVRYMDYAFGPKDAGEGAYLQVPLASNRKIVTVATEEQLEQYVSSSGRSKERKWAEDALDRYVMVSSWSDYHDFSFEGPESKVPRYAEWV